MTDSVKPIVLVVEDDLQVRSTIQDVVEKANLTVEIFSSGEALLDALAFVSPAGLILDLHLRGGLSGLALLKHLRQTLEWLPAIFLTESADVTTTVLAMRSGACNVLEKPVDPQALLNCLHEALELAARFQKYRALWWDFRARLATLSRREREVFRHLTAGKSTVDISSLLGNSPHTVEKQRANILHKLQARCFADLMQLYHAAHATLSLPGIAWWLYEGHLAGQVSSDVLGLDGTYPV